MNRCRIALLGAILSVTFAFSANAASIPIVGYTLLEEISVPGKGASVFSTTVLTNGKSYILQGSGTQVITATGKFTDSEYFYFPDINSPIDQCGSGECDYGIKIDDPTVSGGSNTPFWGAPNPGNHVYEVDWVGDGTTIQINFHDDVYSDNGGGTLVLAIFTPTVVPLPAALPLFLSGLAVFGFVARRRRSLAAA